MLKVIQHVYLLPLILSAVYSRRAFKQGWPFPYKLFSILLVAISLLEIIAFLWKSGLGNSLGFSNANVWLYNGSLIPQYWLYMAVYFFATDSLIIRRIIIAGGSMFTLFAILNTIFFQSIHQINSYTIAIASGFIIFLSYNWFQQLHKGDHHARLTSIPMAWISLGAFVFHVLSLPFLLALDYLTHYSMSLAIATFTILLSLNCIMYTLYLRAFLCKNPHLIL